MIWKCVLKVGKSSLGQRDNSVSVQRRGIVWRELARPSTAAILRCTRVELMALFTAFVTYCPLLTVGLSLKTCLSRRRCYYVLSCACAEPVLLD